MTNTAIAPGVAASPPAQGPAEPSSKLSLNLFGGDRYKLMQAGLFTAGSVLMPLGVLAVGLGWWGAAHSRYAYDQFPYLLSGGFLGVCLTIIGGFLYYGAWLAKGMGDQNSASKQIVAGLSALSDQVERLGLVGLAGTAGTAGARPDPGAALVVAGSNGAAVHRRDCTLIAHREDLREVSGTEAGAGTGLTGCRVCHPVLP